MGKEQGIREQLVDMCGDEGLLFMDGHDDAILGTCERFGQEIVVAYDYKKVIAKHIEDGMTEEEAEEFFSFNQIGAWMGEKTPVFVSLLG